MKVKWGPKSSTYLHLDSSESCWGDSEQRDRYVGGVTAIGQVEQVRESESGVLLHWMKFWVRNVEKEESWNKEMLG